MDQLAHTKEFLIDVALSGFGARRFVGHNELDAARRFVHERAVPDLNSAILRDDPHYNPDPAADATEATSTAAVKAYVAELQRDKVALDKYDEHHTGHIYAVMFNPAFGCFLDELIAAVQLDDPSWEPHQRSE